MSKFHITDDGPKPCHDTTDRCPYAKAGDKHYSNEADARTAYESNMNARFGNTKTSRRNAVPNSKDSGINTKFPSSSKIDRSNRVYESVAVARAFSTKQKPKSLTSSLSPATKEAAKLHLVKKAFS